MSAPPGYVNMSCLAVIQRASQAIAEIDSERKKDDDCAIDRWLRWRRWFSFLPWWKNLTREKAYNALVESTVFFPSIYGWGVYGEAQELLKAAKCCLPHDTMCVAVGSCILHERYNVS